jgi:hypothetical protein
MQVCAPRAWRRAIVTEELGSLVLIDCLDAAARAFQAVRIKLDRSYDERSIKQAG